MCGEYKGDGSVEGIDQEPKEMVVVHWLYFDWVFIKIGVGQCGDGEC